MKILLSLVGLLIAAVIIFFCFGLLINLIKYAVKYTFKLLFFSFSKGLSYINIFNNKSSSASFIKSKLPKAYSVKDKSLFLSTIGTIDEDLVHVIEDSVQCDLGAGNGVPIYSKEYLYTLQGMPSIDKPRYLIAETHGGSFFMVFPSPHLLTTQEYVYGTQIDFFEREFNTYDKLPYYTKIDIVNKEKGTFIHIPLNNIRYFFEVSHYGVFNEFYYSLLNKEKLGLVTDLNQFVSYLIQTYSTEVNFLKEQSKALKAENTKQTTNHTIQNHTNVISLSNKRTERSRKEAN